MKRTVLTTLIALTLAAAANATTIKFLSVNGEVVGNEYVAPYGITVDGTSATVVCLDVNRTVQFNEEWQVTTNTIGSAGLDFASTPNSLNLYKAAAVIFTWMQKGIVSNGAGTYAIWNMFRPSFSTAPAGPAAAQAQIDALNYVSAHADLNYSNIRIFTPVNHGPNNNQYQEFLTGQVATPEPGTFILLGAAMIAITLWNRLRERKS